MPSSLLHEHDAHQGAQSKGEFLGMTGNSSWWLLCSAGGAMLMVSVLWGIFDVPLLACLLAGLGLCALSIAYVFALKNDKPAHYDTDFFESVLIEAGAMELSFGPRGRRPENPFQIGPGNRNDAADVAPVRFGSKATKGLAGGSEAAPVRSLKALAVEPVEQFRRESGDSPTVPLPAFERAQEELQDAQDRLEDALAERGEESYAA
jgi:hypothetical protein